jgi:hypothetical protein
MQIQLILRDMTHTASGAAAFLCDGIAVADQVRKTAAHALNLNSGRAVHSPQLLCDQLCQNISVVLVCEINGTSRSRRYA